MTNFKVLSLQATYRLQVHDFNLKVPTDLIIGKPLRMMGGEIILIFYRQGGALPWFSTVLGGDV